VKEFFAFMEQYPNSRSSFVPTSVHQQPTAIGNHPNDQLPRVVAGTKTAASTPAAQPTTGMELSLIISFM
jgi:hypothetical protein